MKEREERVRSVLAEYLAAVEGRHGSLEAYTTDTSGGLRLGGQRGATKGGGRRAWEFGGAIVVRARRCGGGGEAPWMCGQGAMSDLHLSKHLKANRVLLPDNLSSVPSSLVARLCPTGSTPPPAGMKPMTAAGVSLLQLRPTPR